MNLHGELIPLANTNLTGHFLPNNTQNITLTVSSSVGADYSIINGFYTINSINIIPATGDLVEQSPLTDDYAELAIYKDDVEVASLDLNTVSLEQGFSMVVPMLLGVDLMGDANDILQAHVIQHGLGQVIPTIKVFVEIQRGVR